MAKKIEQPSLTYEQALNMITENKEESVTVRGRKFSFKDITKGAILKVTDLMLTLSDDDPKRSCKCAAALVCNSWWQVKAFFGIGWRLRWMWYYYVRQYTDAELVPVVQLAKKKVEMEMLSSMINTTSLTAMKMTRIARNREEASLSQAASGTAARGQQQRNSPT